MASISSRFAATTAAIGWRRSLAVNTLKNIFIFFHSNLPGFANSSAANPIIATESDVMHENLQNLKKSKKIAHAAQAGCTLCAVFYCQFDANIISTVTTAVTHSFRTQRDYVYCLQVHYVYDDLQRIRSTILICVEHANMRMLW